MNPDISAEELASPFPFSSMSPESFHGDIGLDYVTNTLPSNHDTHAYSYAGNEYQDPWHNLTQFSPVTGDVGCSPYLPSPTPPDDYLLTSLDSISTSHDVIETSISDDNSASADSVTSTTNDEPPNDSVTSKLKAIIMSRQVSDGSTTSGSQKSPGTDSSISTMHNYSSNERKRKHETGDNNSTPTHHGGNRYYPHSSLRFPPCFVCGGTASGLHYGVNSCEPCKGFFTRYLRRREDEFYKCAKQGKCEITNKLRGNCSGCRLQKCLALGMSRKNSRLGRYSLTRRMETIIQVNGLENNSIDETEIQQNPIFNAARERVKAPPPSVTGDESVTETQDMQSHCKKTKVTNKTKVNSKFSDKLVKVLVEHMEMIKPYGEDVVTEEQIYDKLKSHYEEYQLKIEIFGNLKTIPKDEYFNLLKGYGIEIDKRMMFLKQSANEIMDIIERYCNFAKQVPNFTSLSSKDQSNLLKSSRYDFFMILMHEGYMDEFKCFLAHNGTAFHQEEVADKFFSRQLVMAVCDTYYRLQKLQLSKEEKALLIAISLLFTDRCTLENPDLVGEIQLSLTQLLRHQLETTCSSSAVQRFAKIVDCLITMRESSEQYLKEYNQLCQDEFVIEEVPIMTELLFEDK